MGRDSGNFQQFLRALHCRMVMVRGLERMGLGILLASAAALLLLPVFIAKSMPAVQGVSILMILGAIAGLTWGCLYRPTRFDAAMEADRQLNWSDLLSTALTQQYQDDEFAQAVLVMAEARCRNVSPSLVAMNHWGVRGWSGVGLAIALVLTAGMMVSTPALPQAGAKELAGLQQVDANLDLSGNQLIPDGLDNRMEFHSNPAESPEGRRDGSSRSESDSSPNHNQTDSASTAGKGTTGGTGTGSAQTPGQVDHHEPQLPISAGAGQEHSTGPISSGTGRGNKPEDSTNPGETGATAAPDTLIQWTAPWESKEWKNERDSAMEKVRAGEVPDLYRDLIQDYFNR